MNVRTLAPMFSGAVNIFRREIDFVKYCNKIEGSTQMRSRMAEMAAPRA
jgi:hypothetical protein